MCLLLQYQSEHILRTIHQGCIISRTSLQYASRCYRNESTMRRIRSTHPQTPDFPSRNGRAMRVIQNVRTKRANLKSRSPTYWFAESRHCYQMYVYLRNKNSSPRIRISAHERHLPNASRWRRQRGNATTYQSHSRYNCAFASWGPSPNFPNRWDSSPRN